MLYHDVYNRIMWFKKHWKMLKHSNRRIIDTKFMHWNDYNGLVVKSK